MNQHDVIMRYARLLGFGEIHTKIDHKTGLKAIIAIHSTQLGPAIGGARFKYYASTLDATIDVLKLAYHMTLKAAISDLPHGGAKAVLIKPKILKDHAAYFRCFGDFVHEMNGRYITAVDVGTTETEMDIIAERTPYVFGASHTHISEKDPSPLTALGVLKGIEAAVKFKLGRDQLAGLHVAIQGVGHVGYELARLLHERGVRLTVTDPNLAAIESCVHEFAATAVSLDQIYDVDCDVFSPCALGGTINFETVHRLKAPIIAGSANTQLAHKKFGSLLMEKGILYAPDFVINAGGLIHAAMGYDYQNTEMAIAKINKLYDILLDLFERAAEEGLPTHDVAERIAKEKLGDKTTEFAL